MSHFNETLATTAELTEVLKQKTEAAGAAAEMATKNQEAMKLVLEQIGKIAPGLGEALEGVFSGPLAPLVLLAMGIQKVSQMLKEYNDALDKAGADAYQSHLDSIKRMQDAWDTATSRMSAYQAAMAMAGKNEDTIDRADPTDVYALTAALEKRKAQAGQLDQEVQAAFAKSDAADLKVKKLQEEKQKLESQMLTRPLTDADIEILRKTDPTNPQVKAWDAKANLDRKMQDADPGENQDDSMPSVARADLEKAYAEYDQAQRKVDSYLYRYQQIKTQSPTAETEANEAKIDSDQKATLSIDNATAIMDLPKEIAAAQKTQAAKDFERQFNEYENRHVEDANQTLSDLFIQAGVQRDQQIAIIHKLIEHQTTGVQLLAELHVRIDQINSRLNSFQGGVGQ
jgi:hypothetical protein